MASLDNRAPFALPNSIASGRIAASIGDVNLDALNPKRGATPAAIIKTLEDPKIVDEFILRLWNDPKNQDVVQAFLKNDFIWYAARHTDEEVRPYYQAYGIQDYFYLIDYVRFKALRLNSVLEQDWDNLQTEAKSLAESTQWVTGWREVLINDLKVPAAELDKAERSVGELAYANVLQRHASIDDWFDLHVIMIPCIWGWAKLAKMVADDPNTLKTTIFYRTWVEPNLDTSSADKLSSFLDANDEIWGAGIDRDQGATIGKWNRLLRTTLKLEVALFQASGVPHA